MADLFDAFCDECDDDSTFQVADEYDAGWIRGVCTECGMGGWIPIDEGKR